MSFSRLHSGTGHPGGISHVPGSAAEPALGAEELASLSLAERAAHALARDRGTRDIPIDRAFLEASLDLRRAIRTTVAAFIPRFADWCFVDLIDEDGLPRRVEVAPADPEQAPLAAEMLSLGFGPGWATPSAQAIRDRAPRLYRDVSPELLAWATHDERHHKVFSAMGPRSLVAVPLVARGQCIGALTLFRSTMVPPLDESGMVVAEQIAAPAALAIDNARRFEAERTARRGAEERVALEQAPTAGKGAKARPKAPARTAKPRKPARAPASAKRGKATVKGRKPRR